MDGTPNDMISAASSSDAVGGSLKTGSVSEKPRRIQRACDLCRKRKIRCDGKMPSCTNCLNHNVTCVFTPRSKRKGGQRQLYLKSLVSRLEQMESVLRTAAPSLWKVRSPVAIPASEPDFNSSIDDDSNFDDSTSEDITSLTERMGMLLTTPVGEQKYFGVSSALSILQHAAESASSLAKKKLLDVFTIFNKEFVSNDYLPKLSQRANFPPQDVAKIYMDLFFRHYSYIPLYDQKSVYEMISKPHWWENPDGSINAVSYCLYFTILALGCLASSDKDQFTKADAFFANVIDKRGGLLFCNSLDALKLTALIVLYFHCTCRVSAAWITLGYAIRISQTLGLHRNSSVWSIGPDDVQERAVIFWNIYILDRIMAMVTGKPYCLQDIDIDQEIPFFSVYDCCGLRAVQEDKLSSFNFYEAVLQLARINGRILSALYSAQAMKDTNAQISERIIDLDKQLCLWKVRLPQEFWLDYHATEKPFYYKSLLILSGSFYNAQVLLHRHSITKNLTISCSHRPESEATDSKEICFAAARKIVKLLTEIADGHVPLLKALLYQGMTSIIVIFIGIVKNPTAETVDSDIAWIKKVKDVYQLTMKHLPVNTPVTVLRALDSLYATAILAKEKAAQEAQAGSTPYMLSQISTVNGGMVDGFDAPQVPRVPLNGRKPVFTDDAMSASPPSAIPGSQDPQALLNAFSMIGTNPPTQTEPYIPGVQYGGCEYPPVDFNPETPVRNDLFSFPFEEGMELNFSAANVFSPTIIENEFYNEPVYEVCPGENYMS
ncbi:transcription factor [Schizosaccharomyces japonicus yFS275]|uniref:Transcription factor n=1 Tax=Schizosaccharomyces japonicus (strain yFS275 / FY16936) TaxID=402676 RepID=B6JYS2_SCHJY|nr:transcription factor [Schizosaccharomyces japonicus yFS275]EEB06690.2 transcription factor [Schizosaccharomyces japonicus yFS275]